MSRQGSGGSRERRRTRGRPERDVGQHTAQVGEERAGSARRTAIHVEHVRLGDRGEDEGSGWRPIDNFQRETDLSGDGADAVDQWGAIEAVGHPVVVVIGIDAVVEPVAVRVGAVVDQTVAVIVDPVAADLRDGGPGRAGLRHTADTGGNAAGAGADAASDGWDTVVYRAIAVVVDAVADLGGGRAGGAGLRRPVKAGDDRA